MPECLAEARQEGGRTPDDESDGQDPRTMPSVRQPSCIRQDQELRGLPSRNVRCAGRERVTKWETDQHRAEGEGWAGEQAHGHVAQVKTLIPAMVIELATRLATGTALPDVASEMSLCEIQTTTTLMTMKMMTMTAIITEVQ